MQRFNRVSIGKFLQEMEVSINIMDIFSKLPILNPDRKEA
jgi:hypothetical protein